MTMKFLVEPSGRLKKYISGKSPTDEGLLHEMCFTSLASPFTSLPVPGYHTVKYSGDGTEPQRRDTRFGWVAAWDDDSLKYHNWVWDTFGLTALVIPRVSRLSTGAGSLWIAESEVASGEALLEINFYKEVEGDEWREFSLARSSGFRFTGKLNRFS